MAIYGTIDRTRELTTPGQLLLAAYPTSDPGASNTARINAFFALFYQAGDTRTSLIGNPWCNLSPDGLKVKVKDDVVENETNESAKHIVARTATGIDLEWTFYDVDVNHLADALGLSTDEIISIAAATGKAGRKQILLGGSRTVQNFVVLYRTPSAKYAGQFDNFLFLRCVVTVDFELSLNKKDVRKMTVKASCLPDNYVLNAAGFPELAVIDEVTAQAL